MAEGEDTSVQNLAWHDGMYFFNDALRMTVPPNATAQAAASSPGGLRDASVPCFCSDAAPRDTSETAPPPYLVTVDCFSIAQYGNCRAPFMKVGGRGSQERRRQLGSRRKVAISV